MESRETRHRRRRSTAPAAVTRKVVHNIAKAGAVEKDQRPVAAEAPEAWRPFQAQRLRESIQLNAGFLTVVIVLQGLLMVVNLLATVLEKQEPPAKENSGQITQQVASMSLAVVGALGLKALRTLIFKCRRNSSKEWWLCIVHQSLTITGIYFSTLLGCLGHDERVVHRTFLMRFLVALMLTVDTIYLPQPWHGIVVGLQGICFWTYFHYIVDFWKPIPICFGMAVITLEVYSFHSAEHRAFTLVRTLEKEKSARMISDSLKSAWRGLLNVMFDASFECDKAGRILVTSQHLQQLLGSTKRDLVGFSLTSLAANATEANRMNSFLEQSGVGGEWEGGTNSVSPPTVIETVMRFMDFQRGQTERNLRVKLFCASLPADWTVFGEGNHGCSQRLFVGLQQLQQFDRQYFPNQRSRSNTAEDEGDKTHSSQSVTEGSASGDSFPAPTVQMLREEPDERTVDYDLRSLASQNTGRSLAYTWTQFTEELPHHAHTTAEVCVQTDDLTSRGLLQEAGTQVDMAAPLQGSRDHAARKVVNITSQPGAYPECPPRPASEVRVVYRRSHGIHNRRPASKTLDGRRCPTQRDKLMRLDQIGRSFLADFKLTPQRTVEFILIEALPRLNPSGSGCCLYHASLMLLHSVSHEMLLRKCEPLRPQQMQVWQCLSCLSLCPENEEDDEGIEVELEECSLCGAARQQPSHGVPKEAAEEEGSSCMADGSESCKLGDSE